MLNNELGLYWAIGVTVSMKMVTKIKFFNNLFKPDE